MSNLKIFNPVAEAVHNVKGIEKINVGKNWKSIGFCWGCQKDKYRNGGKVFRLIPGQSGGVQRFRCAECVEEKRAARLAKEEALAN